MRLDQKNNNLIDVVELTLLAGPKICLFFKLTFQDERFFIQTQQISPLTATGLKTYCHNDTWIGLVTDSFPALDIFHSVRDQYIVSYYWATATLVSVGYGDIHASTLTEMLCATFIMISGTVFYSFILGGMSASIQTDDQRRGSYKEKISDIKKFFKVYDVSQYTEDQVRFVHTIPPQFHSRYPRLKYKYRYLVHFLLDKIAILFKFRKISFYRSAF